MGLIEVSNSSMDADWTAYWNWNQAVTLHFYPETRRAGPVYLDMEESAIAEIGAALSVQGDVVQEFVRVVRATCLSSSKSFFAEHERTARAWLSAPTDEPPLTIALNGFFSLAAERMSRDQQFRQTNYYARLADLFGIDPKHDQSTYEALQRDYRKRSHVAWQALNEWLLRCGGSRGIPTAFAHDWRTHVGVPISQALLREADRQELLVAFYDMRLSPGRIMARSDMGRLLKDWSKRVGGTSSLHQLIRGDEASDTVADVACQLLENWDGVGQSNDDSVQGRVGLLLSAQMRTFLGQAIEIAIVMRESKRPIEAVAATWRVGTWGENQDSDGTVDFQLGDRLPGAVRVLQPRTAFSLASFMQSHVEFEFTSGERCVREPRRLVILARDDDAGYFIETPRAVLGVPLILFVHESLIDDVVEAIDGTVNRSPKCFRSTELTGLPQGWACLSDVELYAVPNVSDRHRDLHALEPIEWTTLEIRGGLRIPGEYAWLDRAAPSIYVVAQQPGEMRVVIHDENAQPDSQEEIGIFRGNTVCCLQEQSIQAIGSGEFRVSIVDSGSAKKKVLASRRFSIRSSDECRVSEDPHSGDLKHLLGEPAWPISADVANTSDQSNFICGAYHSWGVLPCESAQSPRHGVTRDELISASEEDPICGHPWEDEFSFISEPVDAPKAVAPSCFIGGAHHWQLPDAGPAEMLGRRPYGIPERCKSCGLEHIRPTRHPKGKGKNLGVTSKSRDLGVMPVRRIESDSIVQRPTTQLDANQVISALTYLQSGTRAEFEFLARQVRSEAWFPTALALDLSALGFIDVRYNPSTAKIDRWSVAPLTLYAVHDGWLACGRRAYQQMTVITDEVVELGGVVTLDQLGGVTDINRIHVSGIDHDAMRLVCDDASEVGSGVAQVVGDVAFELSRQLPSISYLVKGFECTWERGFLGEKFDPSVNAWVDISGVTAGDLIRVGRYEKFFFYVKDVSTEGSAVAAVDVRLGKWLCSTAANVELGTFDEECGHLDVKVGCRLPGLYERAVVLPTGRLPELMVRGDGQVFHRYDGVPVSIGRTVMAKLRGQMSEEANLWQ